MKDIRSAEDDRRDSPRVPMTFLVRDADHDEGEWEEREGDLSLGGISWHGKTAPLGREVDVRFRLPGVARELRARGEITLPSNLALEKRTNPFLRTAETSVKQKADERNGRDNRSGAEVFASLRAWKDKF